MRERDVTDADRLEEGGRRHVWLKPWGNWLADGMLGVFLLCIC